MSNFRPLLRAYLLLVCVTGPLVTMAAAGAGGDTLRSDRLLAAALLTIGAALAHRFPLQLTYQTRVDVSSAAYMAMILVLPIGWPGLLALLAMTTGQMARRAEAIEIGFNVGQATLYVGAGAGAYASVTALAGHGTAGVLLGALIAAVVMHVVNTALVAEAAGLQLGSSPLRVWRANLSEDLAAHAALSLLGAVAAALAADQPLLLPALALPAVLAHVAVSNYVRLRSDTAEALAALVDVVELRDPYTAGHSRRVAATARALALALGLTSEEADELESAGRVHDLGKVAIDPLVLAKAGQLTDAEWDEMQLHPGHGATVIAKFRAFESGHPLVRHHHERWDGRGYPDKLAGEDIPLGARILAVADTFDALTSDRPYRAGMSVERALAILREGAGTQWDPRIVAAMVAHCRGEQAADAAEPNAAEADAAPAVLVPARA